MHVRTSPCFPSFSVVGVVVHHRRRRRRRRRVVVIVVIPFFRLVQAAIASLVAASLHQQCLRFLSWSERAWCAIQFRSCVVCPLISCNAEQSRAAVACSRFAGLFPVAPACLVYSRNPYLRRIAIYIDVNVSVFCLCLLLT